MSPRNPFVLVFVFDATTEPFLYAFKDTLDVLDTVKNPVALFIAVVLALSVYALYRSA